MNAARWMGLVVAVVMVLVGGLWTAQGLGYLDGGFTSSSTFSIIGPVLAAFGISLGVVIVQGARGQ